MYTYLPNSSLEEPHEDQNGGVNYFNSLLSDLCPFIINTKSNKRRYALGWRRISRNRELSDILHFVKLIRFQYVIGERFEKTESELLAYEMSITRIIADNSMKSMLEELDKHTVHELESIYK